jgi:hypothetical protein
MKAILTSHPNIGEIMNNSNLLVTAILFVSLGILLQGFSDAKAQIGPSTSFANNPVVSAAGDSSGTLFTAPANHQIVITDVVLTASGNNGNSYACISTTTLTTSTGTLLGQFQITADTYQGNSYNGQTSPSNIVHTFASGLPVPTGETVDISITGNCTVNYTISGYHAHP